MKCRLSTETTVQIALWMTAGEAIDMEACFSQLTLDVIGKAVFNYDFNALTTDSPLIQVRCIRLCLSRSLQCACSLSVAAVQLHLLQYNLQAKDPLSAVRCFVSHNEL